MNRTSRIFAASLAAVVTVFATWMTASPVHAAFPGAAISGTSGSAATPYLAVNSATSLSAVTTNLSIAITGAFDGAITLPPASTKQGQTITVTDSAGIGSGATDGSTTSIVYLVVSNTGTETITIDNMLGTTTRLMLWTRKGTITLVSDGSTGWYATSRKGWHIDPRSYTPLLWYDARRGITLSSGNVSAWADLSGNGKTLVQNTGANQPIYISTPSANQEGEENTVFFNSTAKTMQTSATVAYGNSVQVFTTLSTSWNTAQDGMVWRSNYTAGAGISYYPMRNTSSGIGNASGDTLFSGQGSNVTTQVGPWLSYPSFHNRSWHRVNTTVNLGSVGGPGSFYRVAGQQMMLSSGGSGSLSSPTQEFIVGSSWVGKVTQVIVYANTITNFTDALNVDAALNEAFPAQ